MQATPQRHIPRARRRASAGEHLTWLFFLLGGLALFVLGTPHAYAQENEASAQPTLLEGSENVGEGDAPPTDPHPSTGIGESEVTGEHDDSGDAERDGESAREWSEDPAVLEAYGLRLIGTWRIELAQFVTQHLADRGRAGLAIIAGALINQLAGESYGLVTANADGTGDGHGIWLGEQVDGEGTWELLGVDGDHAQIRLVIPEYGVDEVFVIRHEPNVVHAEYNGVPAMFSRVGEDQ